MMIQSCAQVKLLCVKCFLMDIRMVRINTGDLLKKLFMIYTPEVKSADSYIGKFK